MTRMGTAEQHRADRIEVLFFSTPYALTADCAKIDRLKTNTYKNVVAFPAPKKRRHSVSRQSETTASEGRVRLDDNFVAPLPNGSDIFLWDAELPGFGLRVRQAGSKRWILRYIERGKARVWTIGDAGRMLAKTARAAARKRLGEIALVGLPKRPPRSAAKVKLTTFNQLADQFLADKPFAWKPSTEATAF